MKSVTLALLLAELVFAQTYTVEVHEVGKVACRGGVPSGFTCAIILDIDPFVPEGPDIVSVIGGRHVYVALATVIRQVTLVLGDTASNAVYDPPSKRNFRFSEVTIGGGILARVDGEQLFIKSRS